MQNEFDFLTQETFNIGETELLNNDEFSKEFLFGDSQDSDVIDKRDFPAAAGIVFNIIKNNSTFSLRGAVVENIDESFQIIENGEASLLRALRLDKNEASKALFYEFVDTDCASMVYEQIFNKRYPLEEDLICNISDPGFSWWYQRCDEAIRINFKSHKLEGSGQRLKLGPIGDVQIASVLMSRLENALKEKMELHEFSISDKHFIIKPKDKFHPIFLELCAIFEEGELNDDAMIFNYIDSTLIHYLKELSAIRKFWLHVESLNAEQNTSVIS